MKRLKIRYVDIANEDIQDKRATTTVPCGPGGTLHEYVPFFFAPRPPMLYKINRGGPRYPDRQLPVVHLVSSAQIVYAYNRPAVFTNGHAIMELSEFFTDLADLDKIDWDVMRSRWWNDTHDHPGRKRRRQAEFLVHDHFPWELVAAIGVCNTRIAAEVRRVLLDAAHRPTVSVKGDWYY